MGQGEGGGGEEPDVEQGCHPRVAEEGAAAGARHVERPQRPRDRPLRPAAAAAAAAAAAFFMGAEAEGMGGGPYRR